MAEDELRQISSMATAFGGESAKARVEALKGRLTRYEELRGKARARTPHEKKRRSENKKKEIQAFQAYLAMRGY